MDVGADGLDTSGRERAPGEDCAVAGASPTAAYNNRQRSRTGRPILRKRTAQSWQRDGSGRSDLFTAPPATGQRLCCGGGARMSCHNEGATKRALDRYFGGAAALRRRIAARRITILLRKSPIGGRSSGRLARARLAASLLGREQCCAQTRPPLMYGGEQHCRLVDKRHYSTTSLGCQHSMTWPTQGNDGGVWAQEHNV